MAALNLDVTGVPQDGRIRLNVLQREFDLRVSVIPTVFGESAVMRILDQDTVLLGLEKLGMTADGEARLRQLLAKPNGLFIATGPTGSGRTTTLYSCLLTMPADATKILTIEDPVEYLLPGIVQTGVNARNNFTFAVALRAFLRQDPDTILIGELRDRDTLLVAIQAALTGHLVLTTLHTNSATDALTRLVDIGAESFLVASSVAGVIAQRLIRQLCPACKTPVTLPAAALGDIRARAAAGGYALPEKVTFQQAVGCDQCAGRGYRGRVGLFELLEMTPAVREAFLAHAPKDEIVALAVKDGMRTLFADGMRKAAEGITTVEEVMRVAAN